MVKTPYERTIQAQLMCTGIYVYLYIYTHRGPYCRNARLEVRSFDDMAHLLLAWAQDIIDVAWKQQVNEEQVVIKASQGLVLSSIFIFIVGPLFPLKHHTAQSLIT